MNIETPAVRHEQMRIAGVRVDTEERVDVYNPYTNKVIGTVPAARPEHVRDAFAKAKAFKPKLTRYERQQILLRTAEILSSRKEDFARLITAESGLCWKDSLYEAGRAYDVYSFAGQLTIDDDSEVFSCDISPQGKARKIFTMRTPLLGTISAITPFNHPLNTVSHKIAPAIATNNRVVLKPTELTPLTALALADVLYEAGLPPEMLSIVTGNPGSMGDAMITDPDADLITFTGSVRVGKHIAAKAGYKRLVLELGGNDPLIVMEDADLEGGGTRGGRRHQEFRSALHGGQAHSLRRGGGGRIRGTRAQARETTEMRRSDGPHGRCRHRDSRTCGAGIRAPCR